IIVKKQEEKVQSRWTLASWLETRDRMRLMDLWFALHAPSPYEFFIAGDYQITNTAPGSLRGRLAGYVSIFGLEAQFEDTLLRQHYIFHLRVFGYHAQSTNITLGGGVRRENDGGPYANAFAEVDTTIYIAKYFGIEGLYRNYYA